jgi:hypothetical protein
MAPGYARLKAGVSHATVEATLIWINKVLTSGDTRARAVVRQSRAAVRSSSGRRDRGRGPVTGRLAGVFGWAHGGERRFRRDASRWCFGTSATPLIASLMRAVQRAVSSRTAARSSASAMALTASSKSGRSRLTFAYSAIFFARPSRSGIFRVRDVLVDSRYTHVARLHTCCDARHAFFLEHHSCGRVVEDIVDEELETISLICRRCDASVMLRLS